MLAVAVLCGVAAAGCSAHEENIVNGTVTLDGQPLASGLIRFLPADPTQKRVEALLTAGKFTAVVPPGEHRVEILAPKVTGQKKMYDTPDSPTVDLVAELLPSRYNVASELKLRVVGGEQSENFALTSD